MEEGELMQVSITGNLEIGRINIEGQNFLTVKVDKDGGPMLYECSGSVSEIQFCRTGEDLDGRDPNKCIRLHHEGGNDVIFCQGR
jgi:hypothetical protein